MSDRELTAIADDLLADIRRYYGAVLDPQQERALRADILSRLTEVRAVTARVWQGLPLTRGRGDD